LVAAEPVSLPAVAYWLPTPNVVEKKHLFAWGRMPGKKKLQDFPVRLAPGNALRHCLRATIGVDILAV